MVDQTVSTENTNNQQPVIPTITINAVDDQISINIKEGIQNWQALGLLEVVSKLLRDTYK